MTFELRRVAQFLFAFLCVFGGISLPSPKLGHAFTQAHAALGNAFVADRPFEGGVGLRFTTPDADLESHPWQLTLRVDVPAQAEPVLVPIDLRTLLFLPLAAFVGLALASTLGSAWRNLRLLGIGLCLLEPTLLMLTALPLLSFLGGSGPVRAFNLPRLADIVFQTVYRALVAPPGMMYALPLLLWWALVVRLKPATVRVKQVSARS